MKTNTLLVGSTGTGKTYCLRTFLDMGVTPFIIATEPGIESTLGDLPADKCHWKYIAPGAASWDDLLASAKLINTLSNDALQKLPGMQKQKYTQWFEIITACNNFICDRTGESFGDVQTWDESRVLVLDSLSGLNIAAMNLVVGGKPIRTQPDWGISMDNLERFIITLTTTLPCYFVLTAHLTRITDELTGGLLLGTDTLGKALAPKIPRFFDDVVHCVRQGNQWKWSTATLNVDLKARNLSISDNLPPTFAQLRKKT